MAYYEKIGVLILNQDRTRFLVCEKYSENVTDAYIMPGGQYEEASVEECIVNEMQEELSCDVDAETIEYIGVYEAEAAGKPGKTVKMWLYSADIKGDPTPSTEKRALHWIGKEDADNPRVSAIIKEQIIPDLVNRGILS